MKTAENLSSEISDLTKEINASGKDIRKEIKNIDVSRHKWGTSDKKDLIEALDEDVRNKKHWLINIKGRTDEIMKKVAQKVKIKSPIRDMMLGNSTHNQPPKLSFQNSKTE